MSGDGVIKVVVGVAMGFVAILGVCTGLGVYFGWSATAICSPVVYQIATTSPDCVAVTGSGVYHHLCP